jgi:hypothetical protein
VTTKEAYREAAKEWIAAQAKVNEMLDGATVLDAKAFGEALKRLDETGTKAIGLARQMLDEASQRARRAGRG